MMGRLKKLIGQRSSIRLGWHHARALLAAFVYGFPARRLTMIGITGTDGKTTTVGMTAHILEQSGIRTGALSTAFFQIGKAIEWNATQKTSPSPFVIQRFLRRLVQSGCTHAVLECSSHGLVQGRTRFTWPRVAAITNLAMEHLDYHGTMEQYRVDKGILFRMLAGSGWKVLNADDASCAYYRSIPSDSTILYSTRNDPATGSETGLWLTDERVTEHGSAAILRSSQRTVQYDLSLNIPGLFNLENALCALGCTSACGVSLEDGMDALATFPGIPGRMERIEEGQSFSVYVDFTVTPQAYQKTLEALRMMLPAGKRLLVLTGSCGDRMREKRPIVGKICSEMAEVVVVTNEDPYTEDPEKIIDEVWDGVDRTKTDAHRISDRREAIAFLLARAGPGDIVLFCAKGSDTTMMTKEGQVPWNEREIVRKIIKDQSSHAKE